MNDKYVPKLHTGSLFKNERKKTENHPDYQGSVMLEDGEHWLSAWIKKSKTGKSFMSLSVGELKEERAPKPDQAQEEFNDDIPF